MRLLALASLSIALLGASATAAFADVDDPATPVTNDAADHVLVCTAHPFVRADGSTGNFADLDALAYANAQGDATSPYYHASPAVFVEGFGAMCSLSDVVTYGGDPADFVRSDRRVMSDGSTPDADGGAGELQYVFYAHK